MKNENEREIVEAIHETWIAIVKYNVGGVVLGGIFGLGAYFGKIGNEQLRLTLSIAFFIIPLVFTAISSIPYMAQMLRLKRSLRIHKQ